MGSESRLHKFYRHKIYDPLDQLQRRLTSSERVLPSVLIVGAQKSGTTSLYNYLVQHPAVLPARKKEVHFFDKRYRNGESYYRAEFPTRAEMDEASRISGELSVTCESTPTTMYHPFVMKRLSAMIPEARLIALLRDPVERCFSSYRHQVRRGRETLTFKEAIDSETDRLSGDLLNMQEDEYYFGNNFHHFSHLSRGHYAEQIQRMRDYFPSKQILILQAETFFSEPEQLTNRILDFLGLSPMQLDHYETLNQGISSEMEQEVREQLEAYFKPHNEKLFEMLGERYDWS